MKKILFLIFSIFILFNKNVYAETLTIERTNFYFHRLGDTQDFSDVYKNYSIDGKTAYCIEPGLHEGTEYKKGSWNNLNINDVAKEKIKLYAYYGYDYDGHKTTKYRAATQSLIWKALANENLKVTFSTELFSRGEIYDVSKEEEKIKELASTHSIKPEFDLPENIYLNEKISLTDKKGVIKNYDITSDDASINTRGNTLYITPNKIGDIKVNFVKKENYKENYIIFESEGNQTMYVTGKIDAVTSSINLVSKGGLIKVNKTDEDNNPLEEVSFNLKSSDEKTNITLKTDKDGTLEFKDLPFGKYKLKETKSKEGYELDEKEYTIYLKPDEENSIKNIDIINKKINLEKNEKVVLKDVPKTDISIFSYFIYKFLGVIK